MIAGTLISVIFGLLLVSRCWVVGGAAMQIARSPATILLREPPLAASYVRQRNRVEFGNVRKVIGSKRNG